MTAHFPALTSRQQFLCLSFKHQDSYASLAEYQSEEVYFPAAYPKQQVIHECMVLTWHRADEGVQPHFVSL